MRSQLPGHWLRVVVPALSVASPVAGQIVVTPIAYPGAPADFLEPGAVFDQAGPVVLDSAKRMHFVASYSAPSGSGFAVVRGNPGSFRAIARQGDQAQGLPTGAIYAQGTPGLSPFGGTHLGDDLGNVFFSSTLGGTGVTSSNDFAWWFGNNLSPSLTLREGSGVPGYPAGAIWSVATLARLHHGTLAFIGAASGPGITTDNDAALFLATSSGVSVLIREGDPLPTIPTGTASAVNFGALENDGRALFRATVASGAPGDAALFLGAPGNISLLARALTQAPDLPTGIVYETFGVMDADGLGSYAFHSLLSGAASPTNDQAIFFGTPGAFRKVMRFGEPIPGLAGVTFGSQATPHLAACNGSLIFRARLAGSGVTTSNDDALFFFRNNTLTMLVREGTPVPGLTGVNFGPVNFPPYISSQSAVVFQTPLTGSVTASNNEALFLRTPDGRLTRLLRKGDSINLPSGGTRSITQLFVTGRSPNSGLGRAMIAGTIALQVNVLNPAGGNDQSLVLQIDAGEITPPVDQAWTIPQAFEFNTNSGVLGTSFEVRNDIEITALGYYDDLFSDGEGLNAAHPVGIYDAASSALVASITVPAGTTAPRENLFRYADVSPVRLVAGREYIVAAVATGDNGHNVAAADISVGPGLILGTWRSGGGGPNLDYPSTMHNTTARFMGPSFKYRMASPVPTCPADLDDGSGTGSPDDGVTIDDLVYFLDEFAMGSIEADLDDDGLDPASPDGGVTIDDLVFFLAHFADGC